MIRPLLALSAVLLSLPAAAALSPYYQRTAEMTKILQDATVEKHFTLLRDRDATGVVDKIEAASQTRRGIGYAVVTGSLQLTVTAVYGRLPAGMVGPQPFTLEADRRFQRLSKGFEPSPTPLSFKGRAERLIDVLKSSDVEALVTDAAYEGKATGRISSLAYAGDAGATLQVKVVSGKCRCIARVAPSGKTDDGSIAYEVTVDKTMDCD